MALRGAGSTARQRQWLGLQAVIGVKWILVRRRWAQWIRDSSGSGQLVAWLLPVMEVVDSKLFD